MAQDTTWAGAVLSESDINTYLMAEGGAFTTYTPTWTQSATITKTVNRAAWGRAGRFIYGDMSMTATSSGTANNAVTVSTPVTAAFATGAVHPCGSGWIYDASANLYYPVIVLLSLTTTFSFLDATAPSAVYAGQTGSAFSAALVSTDKIGFSFKFEAAT